MQCTLVILAAGMGSRYGGLKQIDPMGPAGETVLDYTVQDAIRAGFTRVLFVIRREFATEFQEKVGGRFQNAITVEYAFQELDDLPDAYRVPAERSKPWGTGHALWCARHALSGPFAVLNADDFYGRRSLALLADFLQSKAPEDQPVYAMVGFPLGKTLSEHGAVSRGICSTDQEGFLRSIEEKAGIEPNQIAPDSELTPDTPVSMNCWAFPPDFLPQLDAAWHRFLADHAKEPKTEFYLPAAVNDLVQSGQARVRVLSTPDTWFGVTYREDRPRVQRALAKLVEDGVYPSPLSAGNG